MYNRECVGALDKEFVAKGAPNEHRDYRLSDGYHARIRRALVEVTKLEGWQAVRAASGFAAQLLVVVRISNSTPRAGFFILSEITELIMAMVSTMIIIIALILLMLMITMIRMIIPSADYYD